MIIRHSDKAVVEYSSEAMYLLGYEKHVIQA